MPRSLLLLFFFFLFSNHDFLFILFIETKTRIKHTKSTKTITKTITTKKKTIFPNLSNRFILITRTIDIPLVHTFSTTSAPLPPAPPLISEKLAWLNLPANRRYAHYYDYHYREQDRKRGRKSNHIRGRYVDRDSFG